MSRAKGDIERDLKRGAQAGSMSRSQAMGATDPRHRRGAQAEQLTDQRYHHDDFEVDDESRLRLRGTLKNKTLQNRTKVGTVAELHSGTGTPEGVVAAPVGSIFLRTDGSTNTTLYVKETGASTSTGWAAI